MNGYLLIDKQSGVTSFDVVQMVRRAFNVKKVGHCGTLDPLATGLLIVFVGEGTKLLEYFVGLDKEYLVKGKFGYVSDSYDADGEVIKFEGVAKNNISKDEIVSVIDDNFVGSISQVPPKYSALKVDGKRAYALARAGEDVNLKAREVKIDKFEFTEMSWPYASFRIKCGSGTYVRSLVHDLGLQIGVGAYVCELRRTMIDGFSVDDAAASSDLNKINKKLNTLESLVDFFETLKLSPSDYEVLCNGGFVNGKSIDSTRPILAFFEDKIVGVLENAPINGFIKFAKKFN